MCNGHPAMDTSALILVIPLLAGWIADRLLGDPERWPHPVVGFGRWIAWAERRLNRDPGRVAKGALLALGSVAAVGGLTFGLLDITARWSTWAAMVVATVGVFYSLGGETLQREVRAVFRAVERSTEEGRRQLSRIVGRDTSELNNQQIRTAALETLAENLSDGVIAPVLWYLLLGLPGMLAYKMVNTLDSMIGYRNERYARFGRWAARLDDAANYLPARLTALLLVCCAGRPGLLGFVRRYGRCHASPNSGYPEAALAGILGCRFGGPNNYGGLLVEKPYIGENIRELTGEDECHALKLCRRAEGVFLVICALILSLV